MTELEKAARMALEALDSLLDVAMVPMTCEGLCSAESVDKWHDFSFRRDALRSALPQALATTDPVDQPAAPEMFTGSAAKFTANFLAKHTRHTSAASRAKRRREIADAQINVLKSVVEDLRRKARETPAWRNGYCSSITSLEHQIALIQSNY